MRLNQEQNKIILLENAHKQINFMLKQRQKKLEIALSDVDRIQEKNSQRYANIDKHLEEYNSMGELVQLINDYSTHKATQNSKFWSLNLAIEKEVEDKLRELKDMDIQIDTIINQQAEIFSHQEDIEESMRRILTSKEGNYLSKAEPLLVRKTECAATLDKLREQKNLIKGQKLNLIIILLQKLQDLRDHRQKRVNYCRDKKLTVQTTSKLKILISHLKEVNLKLIEIISERKDIEQSELAFKRLAKSLELSNQRVETMGQELMDLFGKQQQMLVQMQEFGLRIQKFKYLEKQLLSKISLKPTELLNFMDRSAAFIREEEDKKKELQQIHQAVSNTNQTIKIFKHIHEAMEGQNKRRADLLKKLDYLQHQQQQQALNQDKIGQIQVEIQKIQGKRQRLQKKLSSKVNQADLNAYKTIHEELQSLDTDFRAKTIIINDMKNELNKKNRQFLMQAVHINEQYSDIASEVMPETWMSQLQFKEEAISQIKAYLSKMLARLKT